MFWPFNKYPGSDCETFNYDWIIGKLKELKDSVAAARASENDAANSAEEAAASAEESAADARSAALSKTSAAADAREIRLAANQIQMNTERINNLIANAGDGTIPSELADIRIGYDNYQYTTAGEAVRDQITDLHVIARDLTTFKTFGDESVTTDQRWAYAGEDAINLVSFAYGDAYAIPLHGCTIIELTGYRDPSTRVFYKDVNDKYHTLSPFPEGVMRSQVITLPWAADTLYVTLTHGYNNAIRLKSLDNAIALVNLMSVLSNNFTIGTDATKSIFPGHVVINNGLDVNPRKGVITYGENIAPALASWTTGGAVWDGAKWVLSEGDNITAVIDVTADDKYVIEMTVSGAYSPSETPVKQKIIFDGTAYEVFGADDANWRIEVQATNTGSANVVIGNDEWYGNIESVSIRKIESLASPAEYIHNKSVNIRSANIAIGNGHNNGTLCEYNTALGVNAQGELTTGQGNTGIGYLAQYFAGNASYNTAVGQGAQQRINTGMYNHAFGYASQQMIQDGCWNVAMGNESQRDITSGCNNIGIGRRAQNSITTGRQNIAIGALAGFARGIGEETQTIPTVTAKNQILIGFQATQTDNDNQYDDIIAIGSRANAKQRGVAVGANAIAAGQNSVAIGSDAVMYDDNRVRIGNSNVNDIVIGNKRLVFNNDGTVTWTAY